MKVNNDKRHFSPSHWMETGALLCVLYFNGCAANESAERRLKDLVAAPSESEDYLLDEGMRAYERGLFKLSSDYFTKLKDGYPGSAYSILAELKIADAAFFSHDFTAAIGSYEEFIRAHPGHEASDYAQYQIANSYRRQYIDEAHDQNPLQLAVQTYQKLLDQYPQSEFATLARKHIDESREKLALHEAYVARLYDKLGQEKASSNRLVSLKQGFSDSVAAREVMQDEVLAPLARHANGSHAALRSKVVPKVPSFVESSLLGKNNQHAKQQSSGYRRGQSRTQIPINTDVPPSPPEIVFDEVKNLHF